MKVAKQLIREFWLPLIVAVIWTIVNLQKSDSKPWDFTTIINLTTPTFFFVSWLTSQYFRVNKQENVASSLSSIEDRVVSALEKIEKQADDLQQISKSQLIQTFDDCIFDLRDAKEELADINRVLKTTNDFEIKSFSLRRGNPFYNPKRQLDTVMGYAGHLLTAGKDDELEERYTRLSYHIEELAGHLGTFIGRLNHYEISWSTDKSCSLLNEITDKIEVFRTTMLPRSKYATAGYKGNQSLDLILLTHVKKLRQFCAQ